MRANRAMYLWVLDSRMHNDFIYHHLPAVTVVREILDEQIAMKLA